MKAVKCQVRLGSPAPSDQRGSPLQGARFGGGPPERFVTAPRLALVQDIADASERAPAALFFYGGSWNAEQGLDRHLADAERFVRDNAAERPDDLAPVPDGVTVFVKGGAS